MEGGFSLEDDVAGEVIDSVVLSSMAGRDVFGVLFDYVTMVKKENGKSDYTYSEFCESHIKRVLDNYNSYKGVGWGNHNAQYKALKHEYEVLFERDVNPDMAGYYAKKRGDIF